MSTFDTLCKILIRDYTVAAESLTPDTTLASLEIDSLGVIELMFEIEDTFKVTVPDGDAEMARDFGTIADLCHFVDRLIAASDCPAAADPAAAAAEAGFATTA